jgi:hypothetical protein
MQPKAVLDLPARLGRQVCGLADCSDCSTQALSHGWPANHNHLHAHSTQWQALPDQSAPGVPEDAADPQVLLARTAQPALQVRACVFGGRCAA